MPSLKKKKRRNPTPLLQLSWLGQKPPQTMGICEHSVLFCHDLSSGGLGLPTFDRIEKLLEIGTIYEAAKTSISLYIPCIIALRSMVLFLVPHESKPELILGQYTPKKAIMQSYFWTATRNINSNCSSPVFTFVFLPLLGFLDKI